MIPEWLKQSDNYIPPKGGHGFVQKTISGLGKAMSKLRVQKGHEKAHALPAILKLFIMIGAIILLSVSHNRILLLGVAAVIQLYLCIWPAKDILSIVKVSAFAGILSLILFLPAMIMNPEGIKNNLMVVMKVFVSTETVAIFNHTTQWNHITSALRKLHIPSVFVFTLDITLKYIVLLGNLITDLLTSLKLRSVGKNKEKYNSVGGVMGTTFLRSAEMSKEMYEAMQCRGFTDDYKGL